MTGLPRGADSAPDAGAREQLGVGLFVGVGIGTYSLARLPSLPKATDEVLAVGRLLEPVLVGSPLTDADRAMVEGYLEGLRGALPEGGPLVGLWCGHALPSPVGVLQLP